MTVRELISELSIYPPDAKVTLETCDNSVDIDHVAHIPAVFRITPEQVQIRGVGWDGRPEDENEEDTDNEEEYDDEEYDSFDDDDEEDDGE